MKTAFTNYQRSGIIEVFFLLLHSFGLVIRVWQSHTQTLGVLKSVNLIISQGLCIYLHAYEWGNGLAENCDGSRLKPCYRHPLLQMGVSPCLLTWLGRNTVGSPGGGKKILPPLLGRNGEVMWAISQLVCFVVNRTEHSSELP